ncbi:MAG: DUF3703 domain-containing protein [Alphaproteobacteria bacterium]|nr:DUF3703 domain-containing protein [Alphaproteobacteria bacterium]
MEYFVGVALALGVGLFTTVAGFDRDRSLYPVILIVVASYYDLFAVMDGGSALGWETGIFAGFLVAAIVGFRSNLWIVVVALVGHGFLDLMHSRLIANPGVPAWWPMFCLSYDAAAGAYLAWRLLSKKIDATNNSSFGHRIRSHVDAELAAAKAAELAGDPSKGFRHLERAHVLGQRSTVQHVRVHLHMLMRGIRHHDLREVIGQNLRVIGAATTTWLGLVPHGNTGGSNVSGFKPMAIPNDLAGLIAAARSKAANSNR